jgi:hypothetical protein
MRRTSKHPYAYVVEHMDGVRSAIVALGGVLGDFCFAARIDGRRETLSTHIYLPMPPAQTTLANFFSPQVNNVEKMFLTGKPSYPVETREGDSHAAPRKHRLPRAERVHLLDNVDAETRCHCRHYL